MNDVKQIWEEIQQSPYPESIITNIVKGHDIINVNRILSACVKTYLATGGLLDHNQIPTFKNNLSKLQEIIPELKSTEQVYYAKLYRLCDLIMERVSNA